MKKLNFKKVFLVIYCILSFISTFYYLINIINLNNLRKVTPCINSSYINSNSKNVKNTAIKTSRTFTNSLVRTKKLQSYIEVGGLELPIQGSTGYASIKMNLMFEPTYNSIIVSTFVPRNWF